MDCLSTGRTVCLIGCFSVLLMNGCAETAGSTPTPDGSHIITPECTEGEMRCTLNILETCLHGQFQMQTICPDDCDIADGCSGVEDGVDSYIWIANSGEGTLSKVNTHTAIEEARYLTCSAADYRCDPSRTSVNLHGDAVVTNRGRDMYADCLLYSEVTKFAAGVHDCLDRNGNGTIDTSSGPTDIKPWGEDECMLWNTELPHDVDHGYTPHHGARATAWDGQTDAETGEGGHVWVGTCASSLEAVHVYRLDGDTGVVVDQVQIADAECAYGGAVDAQGGFWFLGLRKETITRVDGNTLAWETRPTSCPYGITLDSKGRVWNGGSVYDSGYHSCVARYDPLTDTELVVDIPRDEDSPEDAPRLRGIAVGTAKSAGYVWAAETWGRLYQFDEETLEIVGVHSMGSDITMVGVAVDYKGYVWAVAKGENAAYKFDPNTQDFLPVIIGYSPYTYSDMTGIQLRNTVDVR